MARPRGFDEEEVLEAASATFWLKGYEATSTRDLVKCTGLTQPSLYNAFGDKRGLYLRALEHYLDRSLRERIRRLESTMPPAQAITGFFEETIERSVSDPHKRGCMLVNSALEMTPDDEAFRKLVATEIAEIREFFHRCLIAAQKNGTLPQTIRADDAAAHLLATVLGMRVLARVDPQRAVLSSAVASALVLFGLPALPTKPSSG
ncbi:TetR/AcrR family transcriptional regulator [bacterium M00.F.Ca.ET.228.01.1.1]|uniref:TetR/AcrR family transcriptional regulator n=1 Tax=Paraburkholderia phenoliruptrix TaxID=252970 RepID=UPI0010928692|nr:TetR/AcrR family transcriptional regulator [Paraburkholderia phenoliruptrix]TGP47420.1 TetR/AcrR family transcriptional regulator [bacterium M00.F.Ca.ET.228.01.1.1]TGS05212.1 TetR/AcrR family transcriptional regulator [bacterium M00.F.Ca.ET.191.01.1.1]TGU10148.1 TetR/AcrR family transcriptional regulator [bacterium M00.F.Ca.ET.155.01.1.1]MBW0449580.1 TetR/AcrR family transcriptional regulator [Paraburkholderia phenoliruptrix]MBW9101198.1 TetR/AcrR family transcriptional regulator [Paraburkh